MGERRGMKALELWCKRVTDGYHEVKVENMTTSWRDGLAFCAIIHHFRPDLIDFGSLNKADIYRNNELAFRTAEMQLGIPALLDAEDMVECSMPDRLSILTYLSQFYQTFAGSRQSTSPNRTPQGGKRSASPLVMSPTTQTPPTKMALLGPSRREPCAKCHLPVFIAERLLVGGRTLYHRTCFRCARCQHQLSVANCYETEDGQYCCETCPDEVEQKKDNTQTIADTHSLNDTHSLSSEKNVTYSADFGLVLESDKVCSVDSNPRVQDVVSSIARADFMIGQLQWTDEEVTNPYPYLSSVNSEVESTDRKELGGSVQTLEVADSSHVNIDATLEASPYSDNSNSSVEISTYFSTKTNSLQGEDTQKVVEQVPSNDSIKCSDSNNQPLTANDRPEDCLNDQNKLITTCTKESDLPPTSIVKMRMKMFDANHSISMHKKTHSNFDRKSFDSVGKTDNAISASEFEQIAQISDSATEDGSFKNQQLENLSEDIEDKLSKEANVVQAEDQLTLKENIVDENPVIVNDKEIVEDETKPDVPVKLDQEEVEPVKPEKIATHNLNSSDSDLNGSSISALQDTAMKDEIVTHNLNSSDPDLNGPSISAQQDTAMKDETATHNLNSSDPDLNEPSIPVLHDTAMKDETATHNLNSANPDLNEPSIPVLQDTAVKDEEFTTEDPDVKNSPHMIDSIDTNIHIVLTSSEETEDQISQEKTVQDIYPTDLNPFGDEDNVEEVNEAAAINQSVPVNQTSTNPFGSSDEDEEAPPPKALPAGKPPRPPQPQCRQSLTLHTSNTKISPMPRQSLTLGPKNVVDASNMSLNPFWSEGDEPSSDEESRPKRTPVPLPRTQKNVLNPSPLPRLRRSSGQFGSGTSLSSTGSSANSTMRRKKKPAPPPPLPPASTHPGLATPPDAPTPTHSITSSPRTMPRHRKTRPAPPPPDAVMDFKHKLVSSYSEVEFEQEKNEKDEENRTRQIRKLIIPTEEQSAAMIAPNKSTFGQWKRKKGPAPPRPVPPQRREIRVMPMKEVKRELDDIEVQQLELERQGVSLEKTIRSKFEQTSAVDGTETGVTPDVEDFVLQLFEIVNEKNELFRRQAELMYLRRQHRLEEEHADLEYEIRCLLMRPEHTKTDTDKAYEEELIQRLVDVVERRNEIVNSLEMDRRREVEEDLSIHNQLASFAAKTKGDLSVKEEVEGEGTISHGHKKTLKLLKKKVKKTKEKHSKKKEKTGVDSDKDVDESDSAKLSKEKKTKKKWF